VNGQATIRARLAELIEDDHPDDRAFVVRLVTSFLQRAPIMLDQLAAAIDAGDAPATAGHAHALKGAAANLGADGFAALCAEVQHTAEESGGAGLREHPARLAAALAAASTDLRTVIAELPGGYRAPVA
jgi:HPt (histidine-containing phosphotransfer) domain-containing protein